MQKHTILFVLGIVLLLVAATAIEKYLQPSDSSSPESDALIIAPDHPRHLINFSLLDQTGKEVTRQSLKHKMIVVSFLFASCSTVCPYVNAQMAEVQHQTIHDQDVHLLSLTVDPAEDTVPVLAQYAQKLGADPTHWSFVTGKEDVVQNLIATSFLSHDTDTNFSFMPGNFANSQRIALVDMNGQIVKYFDGLNLNAAHAVVQEIQKLRKSTP